MADFLSRLKRRKLVQWALAYLAAAWVLLQVLDLATGSYHWPDTVMHIAFGVLALGFVVALVLAWYHGEQGRQRVSGPELLLIALVLALGGGLLWRFGGTGSKSAPEQVAAAGHAATALDSTSAATFVSSSRSSAVAAVAPIPAQAIPAKSIAVLPFENLSTDKGNAYFADGMQDLILTKLADIGDLKVISRTSTAKYASHPDDLETVGQQLGVATILEGSVQKAGNQVLINVQLIDAITDSHIWAQSYMRTLDNIFGVEGEVTGKIADALKAKLTPAETARVANIPTKDPAAYDDFLRGEHYREMVMAGHFDLVPKAMAAYKQATESDPQFALAWARLALSQSLLMYADIDRSDTSRQQALANAKHALALAPDLPQAHLALGYVYRFDFADASRALAQFEIARRGQPNDAEIEAAIAYMQGRGNSQAALTSMQHAAALNPRNPNLAFGLGQDLQALRRYDAAGDAFRRMLAVAPDDPEAYAALSELALLQHGDVHAAMNWLNQAPADLQANPVIVSQRAHVLMVDRDYPEAQKAVAGLHAGGRFLTPLSVLAQQAAVNWLAGDTAHARVLAHRIIDMAKAESAGKPSEGMEDVLAYTAQAQAVLGLRAEAMHTLDELGHFKSSALGTHGLNRPIGSAPLRALVDLLLGDHTAAIEMLGAALAGPYGDSVSVPLLKLDPFWDPLRKDPRFQALLKTYATPAPASATSAEPAATAASGADGSE